MPENNYFDELKMVKKQKNLYLNKFGYFNEERTEYLSTYNKTIMEALGNDE